MGRDLGAGVEIREIETFLTLAEELHFGRTGERMGVATSWVSQTIRSLERRIGGSLFERTSRRVRLTPLGAALRDGLAPAYEQLGRALADARTRARGITGTLRIGHFITGYPGVLSGAVARFETRRPTARALTFRYDVADYLGPLDRDEVDVMVAWWPEPRAGDEEPGVSFGPAIARVGQALLVASRHPLAGRESVGLDDLAEHVLMEPHPVMPGPVRRGWIPAVAPSGRPLRFAPAARSTHPEEVHERLRGGDLAFVGVSLWPALAGLSASDLVAVPVRDLPSLRYVPFWRTTAETALIRAFAEAAADPATGR